MFDGNLSDPLASNTENSTHLFQLMSQSFVIAAYSKRVESNENVNAMQYH